MSKDKSGTLPKQETDPPISSRHRKESRSMDLSITRTIKFPARVIGLVCLILVFCWSQTAEAQDLEPLTSEQVDGELLILPFGTLLPPGQNWTWARKGKAFVATPSDPEVQASLQVVTMQAMDDHDIDEEAAISALGSAELFPVVLEDSLTVEPSRHPLLAHSQLLCGRTQDGYFCGQVAGDRNDFILLFVSSQSKEWNHKALDYVVSSLQYRKAKSGIGALDPRVIWNSVERVSPDNLQDNTLTFDAGRISPPREPGWTWWSNGVGSKALRFCINPEVGSVLVMADDDREKLDTRLEKFLFDTANGLNSKLEKTALPSSVNKGVFKTRESFEVLYTFKDEEVLRVIGYLDTFAGHQLAVVGWNETANRKLLLHFLDSYEESPRPNLSLIPAFLVLVLGLVAMSVCAGLNRAAGRPSVNGAFIGLIFTLGFLAIDTLYRWPGADPNRILHLVTAYIVPLVIFSSKSRSFKKKRLEWNRANLNTCPVMFPGAGHL